MQDFIRKPAVKAVIFLVSAATLVMAVLGIIGFAFCLDSSFYESEPGGSGTSYILSNIYTDELNSAAQYLAEGSETRLKEVYSPQQTNLRISAQEITAEGTGEPVYSYDPSAETLRNTRTYYLVCHYDSYGNLEWWDYSSYSSIFSSYETVDEPVTDGDSRQTGSKKYAVTMGITASPQVNDRISILTDAFTWLYGYRFTVIWMTVGSIILGLLSHILLLAGAGRRPWVEAVVPGWQEKVPLDVYLCISVILQVLAVCLLNELGMLIGYGRSELVLFSMIFVVVLAASAVLFEMLLGTLATRLKMGKWWRNCLIWKLCAWALRLIVRGWNLVYDRLVGKVLRAIGGFFTALPMVWQGILTTIAILFLEFFLTLMLMNTSGFGTLLWFLFNGAVVFGAVFLLAQMKRLSNAGKKMAEGDLDFRVDTEGMIPVFKEHGENLNAISAGMSHAVDERMRSERMKTELITNVSHDIKTPLTSIVNYVDLLSKEQPENERMQEYISALQRQSARLRKLIEDLVEASKASTGNLSVDLQPCELGVLLSQTAGEYEERLNAQGLTLVVNAPEEPVMVMADSRHIWRVLDNLMGNICKYALPGTRVYMTLEKKGDAVMTLRNISRDQLNLTEEELMERFTRGDSSRSTEGSGLGLSIARSLLELQHGKMNIQVDGDLFKVILHMPLIGDKGTPQPVDPEPHLEITPIAMPEEKKPAEDWGSPGKAPDPLAWENVQKKAYLKTPAEPAQSEAVTKERLKKMAKNPAKWLYGKLKFIAESEDE